MRGFTPARRPLVTVCLTLALSGIAVALRLTWRLSPRPVNNRVALALAAPARLRYVRADRGVQRRLLVSRRRSPVRIRLGYCRNVSS